MNEALEAIQKDLGYYALMLIGGFSWLAAYSLMIRRGFKDKTYAMPFAALCANIAWEFIFSFINLHDPPQLYINRLWFAFDVVILAQFVYFGMKEIKNLTWPKFIVFTIISLITGYLGVLLINYHLKDFFGAYVAFGQNLMMSILFVSMLHHRQSIRGQSIYIAIFKCLGTLTASLAFGLYRPFDTPVMVYFYVAIFVFDVIYIGMLYGQFKKEGISPWKRL
ncbi:MAG: hypothetical protein GY754_42365 [bacterium]|nr:hypothetical protein [bacterium]